MSRQPQDFVVPERMRLVRHVSNTFPQEHRAHLDICVSFNDFSQIRIIFGLFAFSMVPRASLGMEFVCEYQMLEDIEVMLQACVYFGINFVRLLVNTDC